MCIVPSLLIASLDLAPQVTYTKPSSIYDSSQDLGLLDLHPPHSFKKTIGAVSAV